MSTSNRTILFPREWIAEGVGVVTANVEGEWVDRDTGDRLWAARVLLEDGTTLASLTWPRGTHFLRIGPHNHFSIEEKLAPPDAVTPAVRKIWRVLVQAATEALERAVAENGGRPITKDQV